MKQTLILLLCCGFLSASYAQDAQARRTKPEPGKKIMLADVSCGTCKFGMAGDECQMAISLKGQKYYVEGASIDEFGDAHAKDGFCNAIRKAQVQGNVTDDGKFNVTWIKLLPANPKFKAPKVKKTV